MTWTCVAVYEVNSALGSAFVKVGWNHELRPPLTWEQGAEMA
jgi:hypothetical protein